MYLITNRQLHRDKSGVDVLGPDSYHKDATRLRLLEATRRAGRWQVELLPDMLTDDMKAEVGIDDPGDVYASKYVMHKLHKQLRKKKQHLLFFVHGYNNDINAVLNRAHDLEKNYKLCVLIFTWPARGGGTRGTLSYRSDKIAAEESTPAFARVLERFGEYARSIEDEREQRLLDRLVEEYPEKHVENAEERDEFIAKETHEECPFNISFMAHSMGCYVLRRIFEDFSPPPDFSFMQNITLVAADTNNPGHGDWVSQLNPRGSVYITVNERDFALGLSERKLGRKQRSRLGRVVRNFEAENAVYINCTRSKAVNDSHAYFEKNPIKVNTRLRKFFREAFHGKSPEHTLDRQEAMNVYHIP